MRAVGSGVILLLVLGSMGPGEAGAQTGSPRACGICHGDVEFLRQQAGALERARALHVTPGEVASSAHAELGCEGCHAGFGAFPHPREGRSTESCRGCHEAESGAWSRGAHAGDDSGEGAACDACHGVHAVESADALASDDFVGTMGARCVACHEEAALPETDPHRGRVECAGCHEAHETRPPGDRLSSVYPANQPGTCGACHDTVAASATKDVHGTTVARWAAGEMGEVAPERRTPPSCSTCHGAHGMLVPDREGFPGAIVERCGGCHEEHAETYFGTYHGKATVLGSEIVATCDDCHAAHAVFPADDPRSSVAEGRLVETCGACHEHARPAFVQYQSHPDPTDREKSPAIFYSFWFMNALLVGVLGVFAAHTLLWWLRLGVDKRRGIEHGIGGGHE